MSLTRIGSAATLAAAAVLPLLTAVLGAPRAWRLEHARSPTPGQLRSSGGSAMIPAVTALTVAIAVLAAISLLP